MSRDTARSARKLCGCGFTIFIESGIFAPIRCDPLARPYEPTDDRGRPERLIVTG
jgi:hypothetical protein